MDFSQLDAYMQNLPSLGIPCADIIVYYKGELVHRAMVGTMDAEGKIPVSEDTLYDIFSNTKLVTVVAIMQLVEMGKIRLSDPVSKYISEFKNQKYKMPTGEIVPVNSIMTIEHLLTMTAGHTYQPSQTLDEAAEKSGYQITTLQFAKIYAEEPLAYNPGERWSYGKSFEILGAIIEVVSGETLGQYFQKHIFDPIGLKHITFQKDIEAVRKNKSTMWHFNGEGQMPIIHKPYDHFDEKDCPNLEMGGQGLLATAGDYASFLNVLALGGVTKNGKKVLSRESIDQIRKPRLDLLKQSQFIISHMKKGYSYGYGVRTLIDKGYGAKSPIGEFGWDGATGGYGLVDVENSLAICYMQNVRACPTAYFKIFPETRDMIYTILGL